MTLVPTFLLRSCLLVGLVCGFAAPVMATDTNMIKGGKPAPDDAYPWQVRLYESDNDEIGFCGGSIIGSQWILTAAHCTYDHGDEIDKIVVGYGSNDRTKTKKIESEAIIRHPDYNPYEQQGSDIALIKLKSEIPRAPWIGIADAGVDQEMLEPESKVTVTGWGAMWDPNDEVMQQLLTQLTRENESDPVNFARELRQIRRQNESLSDKVNYPVLLHEVDIVIIDQQGCKDKFNEIGINIRDTEICAMQPGTGKDSCNGDSGGPLIVLAENKNKYVQVGVVSWGIECGDKTYPGVYARLSSFNDWIRNQIQSQ